ncbi:winged helix-turn-helix transcriptional regulator [Marinicella sp. W31]|uniref:winged helix-turn-helix transcriptional regulator n=1 Tax=Marinicella sp. W31 TaxID=3023713 RepID=UPI003756CCB5
MNAKNHRHSPCPLTYVLDILGDKWSLLIIRDMLIRKYCRYNQFLESDEGIATNILADRLKKLEKSGIITKAKDPDNRRQNIYEVTQKGLDLIPSMLHLVRWSCRHDPETVVNDEVADYLENKFDCAVEWVLNRHIKDCAQ